MSKKRKQSLKPARRGPDAGTSQPAETAESLTVLWSLCLLTTLLGVLAVVVTRLIAAGSDPASSRLLLVISDVVLMISVLTGTVGGLLTPIVQTRRRRRAPRSIEIAAYVIAVAPWLVVAALMAQAG